MLKNKKRDRTSKAKANSAGSGLTLSEEELEVCSSGGTTHTYAFSDSDDEESDDSYSSDALSSDDCNSSDSDDDTERSKRARCGGDDGLQIEDDSDADLPFAEQMVDYGSKFHLSRRYGGRLESGETMDEFEAEYQANEAEYHNLGLSGASVDNAACGKDCFVDRSSTISPMSSGKRLRNPMNTRSTLMTIHMIRYHTYTTVREAVKEALEQSAKGHDVQVNKLAAKMAGIGKNLSSYAHEHGLSNSCVLARKYQSWKELDEDTVHCERAKHVKDGQESPYTTVVTQEFKDAVFQTVRAERDLTAAEISEVIIQEYKLPSSVSSVKVALKQMGCRHIRPKYRPGLSQAHLKKRLAFARQWKSTAGNSLKKFKQHVWIDYKWFWVRNSMRKSLHVVYCTTVRSRTTRHACLRRPPQASAGFQTLKNFHRRGGMCLSLARARVAPRSCIWQQSVCHVTSSPTERSCCMRALTSRSPSATAATDRQARASQRTKK